MTSCWRSQSSIDVSNSGFEIDRPALLTTMSTPPKARTASRKPAATWASSVTSQATLTAASGPPISSATAWALAASMSATTTHAPSAASRSAIARPMPEPAPVTNATRPASGRGAGWRASLASSSDQYSIRNFSDSGIGAYGRDRLGAAHDVDRVDVELAGDPGDLLRRAEAEHADAGDEHDRRVGAAHRRAVGAWRGARSRRRTRRGTAACSSRSRASVSSSDADGGRSRTSGRTFVRRKWSGQDVPSAASRRSDSRDEEVEDGVVVGEVADLRAVGRDEARGRSAGARRPALGARRPAAVRCPGRPARTAPAVRARR